MVRPRIPPAERLGGLQATQERNDYRLDDLERTDGSQYVRAIEKIKSLISGLADQVQAYITLYSYTRTQILALTWNVSAIVGILPPVKGGTGTANAYSNTFTTGSWRATWSLSDGTLGYAPSLRALKRGIRDAAVDVTAWLSLPVKQFRYRADVEERGDNAELRLGFIAEDLEEAGLEPWLYRGEDGQLQGVAYELVPLAHHEIIRAQQARIDELEQRIVALERKE